MSISSLDEKTKKEINELTKEEISRSVSYAYEHEILWYGIAAVAHVHIMQKARDISDGKISLDEFIKKYDLNFESYGYGFSVSLEKIESDGIFIPQQVYQGNEKKLKRLKLFKLDYRNRTTRNGWREKEYAEKLMTRSWQPSDLTSLELLDQGDRFGPDMWITCYEGFYKHINLTPQPQKVTDLAEKLMAYYSAVISETTYSNYETFQSTRNSVKNILK